MLELARRHALDRKQFGKPVASFQAVRHRLAETLVAIEGAEATLIAAAAEPDELSFLLAKAAAGQGALTAARHCQQVLGGIGFTAEHALHRHVKRVLFLDGLLGSSRELTREAGAALRARGFAPDLRSCEKWALRRLTGSGCGIKRCVRSHHSASKLSCTGASVIRIPLPLRAAGDYYSREGKVTIRTRRPARKRDTNDGVLRTVQPSSPLRLSLSRP